MPLLFVNQYRGKKYVYKVFICFLLKASVPWVSSASCNGYPCPSHQPFHKPSSSCTPLVLSATLMTSEKHSWHFRNYAANFAWANKIHVNKQVTHAIHFLHIPPLKVGFYDVYSIETISSPVLEQLSTDCLPACSDTSQAEALPTFSQDYLCKGLCVANSLRKQHLALESRR